MKQFGTVPPELKGFFEKNPSPALAFSGGADSSYLFYAALACGADVTAYFVKTQFQPLFELRNAIKTSEWLGHDIEVISLNALEDPTIRSNPADRCYHCKKHIFGTILAHAKKDGKGIVIDATNASDDPTDRPGMKALAELGVVSPLRLAGITKPEVRCLSREAGLWTWNLPSNSCLATRIPTDTEITNQELSVVEETEDKLHELGFEEIRARSHGNKVRLEVTENEQDLLNERKNDVEKILQTHYSKIEFGTRNAKP